MDTSNIVELFNLGKFWFVLGLNSQSAILQNFSSIFLESSVEFREANFAFFFFLSPFILFGPSENILSVFSSFHL